MVIIGFISGFVIWIVGKLGIGLEVRGFGSAFIAAIVIAAVAGIFTLLLAVAGVQDGDGLIGGIAHLIIAAVILMISARFLPGLKVSGFGGVLLAAAAIGAFYWLGGSALGQIF
jgi:putative membrane protein